MIIWRGIGFQSFEICDVNFKGGIIIVKSVIAGKYYDQIYRVEYRMIIDEDWEVSSFGINAGISNMNTRIEGYKNTDGNWVINNQVNTALNSCIDVDISLTPFTNTLPVNRLKLHVGQSKHIKVLYMDLLENKISPVEQLYSRISETQYFYKNIPTDFRALITVDEYGLVTNYPGLFERVVA